MKDEFEMLFNKYFRYDEKRGTYASQDAGITENEIQIPVIVSVK